METIEKKSQEVNPNELSEEDLNQVAGGGYYTSDGRLITGLPTHNPVTHSGGRPDPKTPHQKP